MFATVGQGIADNSDVLKALNLLSCQGTERFSTREECLRALLRQRIRQPIHERSIAAHHFASHRLGADRYQRPNAWPRDGEATH